VKSRWFNIASTALVSLLLAIGIWYFARGQVDVQENFSDVPLEIRAPRDFSVQTSLKAFSRLTVAGPRAEMEKLRLRNIEGVFSLTNDSLAGQEALHQRAFTVTREWFDLPEGIRLVKVVPSVVPVKISPIVARRLRVLMPAPTGSLAPGFAVKKVTLTPSEVDVSGPRDLFEGDGIRHIETYPLALEGHSSSFTAVLRLKRKIGDVVLDAPETVIADVTLGREDAKKVFTDLPIQIMFSARTERVIQVRLDPPQVAQLTMLGPAEYLEKLKQEDIKPFVEIDDEVLADLARGNQRKVELKCFWPRLPDVRPVWENLSVTVDRKSETPASKPY